VAMSFQSFQDDTVRVEYTRGQPKGVVSGQFGNTPHRIDIFRQDRKEGTGHYQYVPGKVSSQFILQKNTNGYSEREINDADVQSNDGRQPVSDYMVSELRKVVTNLEDLLLCPVDVEFAIDHQGCLFVLQVRPITRLSGGMDFAMDIPEDSLAIGETVSEGYCTGPIWLAKKQEADTMPHGAIVVAHHAEEWMLVSEFLKRARGFVIAEGGFNDHVAILMRQEKTPLMLAGGEYETVVAQDGQQATLGCARFNGKSGAFIVTGDMTRELASHRSLSSVVSDVSSVKAAPSRDDLSPPEGTFCQVASGFQWLTDQNARLLGFFAPDGGLGCLANPIKLSMSPQRSKLLAETIDNINRLIHGAEKLLDGYRAFLQLAIESCSPEVQRLLNELPELICRFETLKKTIQSGLKSIILPMQAAEEGQVSRRNFRQWIEDCYQLQCCLQALKPNTADQVRSVHELIFTLHQRFVEALAP
ncbi:PEP/pyruvate-binding domain-containing protein, partial [Endozoicomonas sp. ONNA1]